jgi:hypothetical protein
VNIVCPKCTRTFRLSDRKCGCGLELTLRSVIRFYWNRLFEKAKDAAVVQCGNCPAAVPLGSAWCPACQRPVNVRSAFDSVVNPPRRRWSRFFASMAPMERLRWEARTQWTYMLFSLSLLWWVLAIVDERFPGDWIGQAAMACVLLTGLGFAFLVAVPRRIVQAMIQRSSGRMKLALMANYLTAILALRIFTTTWHERALILIGMFISTWIAGWLLSRLVWPMKEEFADFYRDKAPDTKFDSTGPQGRTGRRD